MGPSWRRREPCPPLRFWRPQRWAGARSAAASRCRSTRTSTPRSTTVCGAAPRASSGRSLSPTLADRIRTLANERLDELLAARYLRPHPGLRRHRRRLGGVRIVGPAGRTGTRGAGHRQRRKPGPAGQRRGGCQRAAGLSGVPGPDRGAPPRRRAPMANCQSSTTCSPTGCPTAPRSTTSRPPPRCWASSSAERKRCRRSSRTDCGSWVGDPTRLAAVRADLGRQCARRARGDDPLLRACAVVRPHRAQTVHDPRHHDRTGSADHHAARIGQPRRARVRRTRRVRLESAHRAPAGLRARATLLSWRPSGPSGDRDHGVRMAEDGCPTTASSSEAASRPPSSFQWGWNNIPVEV